MTMLFSCNFFYLYFLLFHFYYLFCQLCRSDFFSKIFQFAFSPLSLHRLFSLSSCSDKAPCWPYRGIQESVSRNVYNNATGPSLPAFWKSGRRIVVICKVFGVCVYGTYNSCNRRSLPHLLLFLILLFLFFYYHHYYC